MDAERELFLTKRSMDLKYAVRFLRERGIPDSRNGNIKHLEAVRQELGLRRCDLL